MGGYSLKESLKTLCGVNQWSYAIFWKTGCQNPKLLIWEECYYEPASCYGRPGISRTGFSEIPHQDYSASSVSTGTLNSRPGGPEGNKVHLLVNKMMVDNHVNVVGEGLVGRVAFTGNHQWILSENYYRETHPPEVLKEVCLQFSAGMQTVAVVPILPHGVAQFGSYSTIPENIGFINGVVSLIHELGCVPGVLQSANHEANELASKIGFPTCSGYTTQELPIESSMIDASSVFADSLNYVGCPAQNSAFDSHIPFSLASEVQNEMQSSIAAFQASSSSPFHLKSYDFHDEVKTAQVNKLDFSFPNQFMNGLAKAEVIPSNSLARMNHYSTLNVPRSIEYSSFPSSSTITHASVRCTEQKTMSDYVSEGHFIKPVPSGIQVPEVKPVSGIDSPSDDNKAARDIEASINTTSSALNDLTLAKMEMSFSDSGDHSRTNSLLAYFSGTKDFVMNKKFADSELDHCKNEMKQNVVHSHEISLTQHSGKLKVAEAIPGFVGDDMKLKTQGQCHQVNDTNYNACFKTQPGDDLFDILGADFKDKWFSSSRNSLSDESATIMHNCDRNDSLCKSNLASSEIYSSSQRKSDSAIFSYAGTDHLLDAVVSKVHPFVKQSLDDDISCSTALNNTSSSSASKALLPYGRFGVSDHVKGDLLGMPKYTAKAGMICSSSLRTVSLQEDSGLYSRGSSIHDPWIERGHNTRQCNSATTGYSTKPHEPSKTNRKRLKPGENPRPRPKDRQMIQDRVKELREIVPHGAKCSIDALLERTIKHMLFLQSVTKHADKLKQTAESKIISKDGGLLLKDNFGGATWAYEVGSQSMVCPIIVEDLNQPHQMLVEMLCEERGLFLEIADIIRGLGLTILKGLMETRNDKIWARFTVEANRNVTRMEIFLSLVRLLEQNAKCDVPQSSSTNNAMVQQVHQALAASVPASGGPLNDMTC
ncbi:transcription factor-like protein [Perilla frutescens var. frutescens]|nr:transcription factor-like protein [Perilla frutescens var. frutescens]